MKKSISVILAIATIAVALCAAVTVCWLDESTGSVDFNEHFHGSTEPAYFAGGTGRADSPYEIRSAVHLYNLAWLQYLGYFNMNPDFNNGLTQSHFVVKEKVDMSAFKSAIPPIGTTEYPFIGVFDGGDNTIVSVRVSNNAGSTDNALKIRPSNAEFNGTTRLFVTDKSAEVSVVGLFGVTGDYDGYIAKYKAANAGFTDENAAVMSVGNFYADYLHIYSGSAATLTGLVAGYAGSGISNVGVYRGDINYASGANGLTALSGSASVTSKYALVGAYNENVIEWGDTSGSDGDNPDWGGSVDMKSMHSRLSTYRTTTPKKYVDSGFNDSTSYGTQRFYDENKGSVYFKSSSNDTILYLSGGKVVLKYKYTDDANGGGFYIKSGNNYLTVNKFTQYATGNTTTEASAVTWYFTANGKGIYTYKDDQKMYLGMNTSTTLTVSSAVWENWTRTGNRLSAAVPSNNNTQYYTYYLGFLGSAWRGQTSGMDLTFESTDTRRYYTAEYTYKGTVTTSSGATENRNFETYIPLNTDADGNVLQSNTGYMASGPHDTNGDIRFRHYPVDSGLSVSLNGDTSFGDGSKLELLTRNKHSSGFVRIKDTYNQNNESVNSAITNITTMTVSDLGLKKYTSTDNKGARDKFNEIMKNAERAYGVHFMNTQISINNIYTADKAVINKETYTDYEMTANSIDFKVEKKGYVNFFAGTYYSGNRNFFSLHHIFRDETTKKITRVKEISKIYSRPGSASYVYLYSDGSYSENGIDQNTLTLEFDCEWITNPTMVNYAVYYFEMPVNGGEYALGSASTGDGAYLMYLDIGASATGGDEGKDHTIKSLYFVNTDTVTLDNAGNYPEFNSVTFEIAEAGTGASSWAAFERKTTENADGTTSVRYNYSYITAVTPTGKGEYDGTLAPTNG